jgi:hypothetical protein
MSLNGRLPDGLELRSSGSGTGEAPKRSSTTGVSWTVGLTSLFGTIYLHRVGIVLGPGLAADGHRAAVPAPCAEFVTLAAVLPVWSGG